MLATQIPQMNNRRKPILGRDRGMAYILWLLRTVDCILLIQGDRTCKLELPLSKSNASFDGSLWPSAAGSFSVERYTPVRPCGSKAFVLTGLWQPLDTPKRLLRLRVRGHTYSLCDGPYLSFSIIGSAYIISIVGERYGTQCKPTHLRDTLLYHSSLTRIPTPRDL